MKKLFILFVSFIFLCLPAFAEYKPIPDNLKEQYKNEVEQTINNKYKTILKQIDNIHTDAKNKYLIVKKNKDTYIDFAAANFDTAVFTPIFDLLSDIISITQKYTDLEPNIPATDYTGALYDFLDPYFSDNNIDTSKIDNLSKYARKKQIKIEKYYEKAHKFIYPNDNY